MGGPIPAASSITSALTILEQIRRQPLEVILADSFVMTNSIAHPNALSWFPPISWNCSRATIDRDRRSFAGCERFVAIRFPKRSECLDALRPGIKHPPTARNSGHLSAHGTETQMVLTATRDAQTCSTQNPYPRSGPTPGGPAGAANGTSAPRWSGGCLRVMPSCFGPPTPTRARRPFDASVDPTEARNDILGCFGQSDRPTRATRQALRFPSRQTIRFGDGGAVHSGGPRQ